MIYDCFLALSTYAGRYLFIMKIVYLDGSLLQVELKTING
jgi:hypothetical protein